MTVRPNTARTVGNKTCQKRFVERPVGKQYFSRKTANINVQTSVYTLVNGNI